MSKKKFKIPKIGNVVQGIKWKDVTKAADFGHFYIVITESLAAYVTYVGYNVITKRYTTSPQGEAGETSLYRWLDYVTQMKPVLEKQKDIQLGDAIFSSKELLDVLERVTTANVMRPYTVFTNLDLALYEASKNIDELDLAAEKLQNTMMANPDPDDFKAEAEILGEALDYDNLNSLLGEMKDNDNTQQS